jgi:hypothetical protein
MSKIGDLTKKLEESKKKLAADKLLSATDKSNLTSMIDLVLKKAKGLPATCDTLTKVIEEAKTLKQDVTKYNSDQGGVKVQATLLKAQCDRMTAKSPVLKAITDTADGLKGLADLQAP